MQPPRGHQATTPQTATRHGEEVIQVICPAHDTQVLPSDINWGPEIGRGSYGNVFEAHWRGGPVAIKTVEVRGREQLRWATPMTVP